MPVILPDTPPPPGGLAIGKGSTLYLKISPFASTSRHDVSPMVPAVLKQRDLRNSKGASTAFGSRVFKAKCNIGRQRFDPSWRT